MLRWFSSPPDRATGSPITGKPISLKISWASMMAWSLKTVSEIFSCMMLTATLASGRRSASAFLILPAQLVQRMPETWTEKTLAALCYSRTNIQ